MRYLRASRLHHFSIPYPAVCVVMDSVLVATKTSLAPGHFSALKGIVRQLDTPPFVFEKDDARVYVRPAVSTDVMWESGQPEAGLQLLVGHGDVFWYEVEYRTLEMLGVVLEAFPDNRNAVVWDDHGGVWLLADFLDRLRAAQFERGRLWPEGAR